MASVYFHETMKLYDKQYRLTQLLLHWGTRVDAGHYTCIVAEESHWIHYNDGESQKLSFKDVLSLSVGKNAGIKTVTALVYSSL
jgi:ubiquitin C-terminal hydrolase